MYKYKDVVFSLRGNLVDSLSRVYGIGLSRAYNILDSLGFSRFFKTIYMNYYYHSGDESIFHYIKNIMDQNPDIVKEMLIRTHRANDSIRTH